MKLIIFLAIFGLALAGLRGDKKRIPHLMPQHHHASHHASKTSGHGHSSNSENSEELFNFLGALESTLSTDLQDTIDTIKGDIQGTADTLSGDVQGTIATLASQGTSSTKKPVAIKKLPKTLPHSLSHHSASKKGSSHGHSSNSENSEELFSLLGAIQDTIANDIQGTTDTIQGALQGTADTVSGDLQGTADTICDNAPGVICNDAQGTADTVSGDLEGTADTLNPIINATGSDIAYATQHLNTTQVAEDVGEGVALAGTALKTAGDVMKIVDKGVQIASVAGALAFVDVQGIIQQDIQGTIDTIQGDIQGTVDTLTNDVHGTAATITGAVESVSGPEFSQAVNDVASGVGTGLKLANSALGDVNDGLSIANSVIP